MKRKFGNILLGVLTGALIVGATSTITTLFLEKDKIFKTNTLETVSSKRLLDSYNYLSEKRISEVPSKNKTINYIGKNNVITTSDDFLVNNVGDLTKIKDCEMDIILKANVMIDAEFLIGYKVIKKGNTFNYVSKFEAIINQEEVSILDFFNYFNYDFDFSYDFEVETDFKTYFTSLSYSDMFFKALFFNTEMLQNFEIINYKNGFDFISDDFLSGQVYFVNFNDFRYKVGYNEVREVSHYWDNSIEVPDKNSDGSISESEVLDEHKKYWIEDYTEEIELFKDYLIFDGYEYASDVA